MLNNLRSVTESLGRFHEDEVPVCAHTSSSCPAIHTPPHSPVKPMLAFAPFYAATSINVWVLLFDAIVCSTF
jgi:hypothetical protein